MKSKISAINKKLIEFKYRKRQLKQLIEEKESQTKQLKLDRDKNKKSIIVFEYIINNNYNTVIELFEKTIGNALQDVFDEDYQFKFHLDKRGESTTCDFMVHTGEYPGFADIKSQGKSLKEIISVILRIIIIKLNNDMPNILILDEPFGGLQPERQKIAGDFLKNIAKEFELQIIMVTQSPEFAECADKLMDLRNVRT